MSLWKMRLRWFGLGAASIVAAVIIHISSSPHQLTGTVTSYFSPKGGCKEAAVEAIGKAKNYIHVQAYAFTSDAIRDALIAAKKRGVKVVLIIDSDECYSPYSDAGDLFKSGADVRSDGKHPIAHNKVIIIDGNLLISGSFNWTEQANNNAENMLVFEGDAELCRKYDANFQKHLEHSVSYDPAKVSLPKLRVERKK